MLESLNTNNLFEYEKLTPEEMKARGILGRLSGVIADTKNPTRNGRHYSDKLWENVFNNPIMQEKIANRCVFGELGHPTDRTETDIEKIAICLSEQPKKGGDGKLYGVFDILDTPNGRILKSLCDYGCTIGVSSRGEGDTYTDYDGNESVDPDTYSCECWDAVLIPAVKEARMSYVTESYNGKTLSQALTESYNKSSDEDKKIMKESLTNLGIELTEEADDNKSPSAIELSNAWCDFKEHMSDYKNIDDYLNLEHSGATGHYRQQLYNFIHSRMGESLSEDLNNNSGDVDGRDLEQYCEQNGLYCDYYFSRPFPLDTIDLVFRVEGDWKHEHERFKYLVNEWAKKNNKIIFKIDSREVNNSLEDYKSDYYAAEYEIYICKDEETYNRLKEMSKLFESVSIKRINESTDVDMEDVKISLTNDDIEFIIDHLERDSKHTKIDDDELEQINDIISKLNNPVEDEMFDFDAEEPIEGEEDISTGESPDDIEEFDVDDESVVDNEDEMIDQFQEALRQNKQLEQKIIELNEKLSVSYAKEKTLNEKVSKYKEATQQLSEGVKKSVALTEAVNQSKSDLDKQISFNKTLKEQYTTLTKENNKLKETVNKQNNQIKSLSENFDSSKETNDKIIKKLNESIADLKKDLQQNKSTYSKKLDSNMKLIEQYKKIAQQAINKYIESEAIKLGVSTNEIKNRLPESYSFNDIKSVCEELQQYKISVNRLPFNAKTSKFNLNENVEIKANSSKTNEPIFNNGLRCDDEIDEQLLQLAGLK